MEAIFLDIEYQGFAFRHGVASSPETLPFSQGAPAAERAFSRSASRQPHFVDGVSYFA
jgi:hypothetical protein